jgi:hypothetical protein
LLLQLATQLAAAALLFSKHQPNPSAASIHDLHSFTAKKKEKEEGSSILLSIPVKGRSIAFLSISAQKRSNFLDFVLYRFLCIRMMIAFFFYGFFSRVQDLLSDFY